MPGVFYMPVCGWSTGANWSTELFSFNTNEPGKERFTFCIIFIADNCT